MIITRPKEQTVLIMNIEDKLPNAERILLTKIIEASPDENYKSIEDEILKVTKDPAHKIVIDAMHEYAKHLLDVVIDDAKENINEMEEIESKIKIDPDTYISQAINIVYSQKHKLLRFKELLK